MQDTPPPPPAVRAALEACTDAATTMRVAHADTLATVAELDRLDAAAATGYRSLRRLLEELLRVDGGEARRLITHARLLVHPNEGEPDDIQDPEHRALPATGKALAAGDIGPEHVEVIAAAMRRAARVVPALPTEVLDTTEAQLADLARADTPRQLAHDAAEVLARLDPDGEPPHDTDRPAESLRMSINRRGECSGRFRFADPEVGRRVYDEITARTPPPDPDADTTLLRPGRELDERRAEGLRHLVDDAARTPETDDLVDTPCPDCDHADDLLGDPTDTRDDGLTDAVADDADPEDRDPEDRDPENALSDDPAAHTPARAPTQRRGGRGPDRPTRETTMIVTVPLEALEHRLGLHTRPGGPGAPAHPGLALLDGLHPVTPETARRLACDAAVIPAVLGTRGEILDLGRKTRTVSAAQRRAVITRDRHCAHPGCRRSPRRCDVHHIIPWAQGGPTDLDHLVLLCPAHHHEIHHTEWEIHMNHRRPVFIPPSYIDPERRPRANHGSDTA